MFVSTATGPALLNREHAVDEVWHDKVDSDGHLSVDDAIAIVEASGNSATGRAALDKLLGTHDLTKLPHDRQAESYLRISADIPLPIEVLAGDRKNQRLDAFFADRQFTGLRLSKTHEVQNPKEMLYFDLTYSMVHGTVDNLAAVRNSMRGSGYEPVVAKMPDGREKAIAGVFINDVHDSTFGPYKEFVFVIAAVPTDARQELKSIDYVNGLSAQVAYDKGATMYIDKLWLDEIRPIDGGNDFLHCNKDLGALQFSNDKDGLRRYWATDKNLDFVVRGSIPYTITEEARQRAGVAYSQAAIAAGSKLPTTTQAFLPIASRPDGLEGPATRWGFSADLKQPIVQEVTPEQVAIRFGKIGPWGQRYNTWGFTPASAIYAKSAVAMIHQPGDPMPETTPAQ